VFAVVAMALIHAAKPEVISSQKIGEDTITVTRQVLRAPDPENVEGEYQIAWRRSGPGHPDERRLLYRGHCQIRPPAPDEEIEIAGRSCRVDGNSLDLLGWTRNSGRRWRLQLAPLLLASQGSNVQQGAGGAEPGWPRFEVSWDWRAGTGGGKTIEILRNRCVKGAAEDDGRRVERQFLSVPMISTPEAYRKDGWKRVPLGSCGLEVGGATSPGFLLQGERKGTTGPAFKALLMSEKELLVEVYEAGAAGSAPAVNWLHDDHLEVWMGSDGQREEPYPSDALQWGIRLSDGAVFPAFGKPREPLKVERAARNAAGGGEAMVFKITLPSKGVPEALAVSYSKGREGKKVEYLLGTSALCFGTGETLGVVTTLPERFGRCEVEQGTLNLAMVPAPSDQPLVTEHDLLQ
jgi:hypothetical protein